jgi:Protein of unknown function (DUF1064)
MSEFTEDTLRAKGFRKVGDTWIKGKPNPKDNIPIKNKPHKYGAKSKEVDGVHYDSTREYDFKCLLDFHKIPYTMKEVYVLQEGFKYMGETIRSIKIIPDFQIHNRKRVIALVDIKGIILPNFLLKIKMLKQILHRQVEEIPIFLPTNKKEMQETIQQLLNAV